ncbi:hypothetical protein GIB67_024602 [Kingdonia uniflora]|uniref:C2 domain-containing protein n=1 Tax=Kingdonia uniflora TaxID=39325 RepID=A0A7J7LNY3_9MAGN|nr:hypothetical protein GIB67_024602 [Kingdonia uniflora]
MILFVFGLEECGKARNRCGGLPDCVSFRLGFDVCSSFLREVYDGELLIKLKKGDNFPAMDPWGTSDPYVILQLDGQLVKSNIKWATKDPVWNQEFTLNIKIPSTKYLQIAAWDANLVAPHKRMGNAGINVESLCNGNLHELQVELEGLGGGGRVYLEVKYKSFDEVNEEKQRWKIPYISDLLAQNSFESALKMVSGPDTVNAKQFVQYAFGQLRLFSNDPLKDDSPYMSDSAKSINPDVSSDTPLQKETSPEGSLDDRNYKENNIILENHTKNGESTQSDTSFWENFGYFINQTISQKLDFPVPEMMKWDGVDLLNKFGLQSKKIAEEEYVEFGLAAPLDEDVDDIISDQSSTVKVTQSSFPDIKKLSWDVLRQTDSVLGALMVMTSTISQQNNEVNSVGETETEKDNPTVVDDGVLPLNQGEAEEMKALFTTAESAMEAWAMLATSLGQSSFIKSEFEKICFLDNTSTDTQVAIWRDSTQKRLVVAFRGTEQTRWKDLLTDLMLAPAGLNPERVSGDFKEEVQVHSGFLSAYDSVRTKLMSLIKLSIGYLDDCVKDAPRWHIYVTGHSLGGALATLLSLELSSSQMAKQGEISLSMYNFGSPRVGNKRFVDVYNEKVKDSWRVVNHKDIIPTVPRLMGYCHVAQPVYLAAGNRRGNLINMGLLEDGYRVDVIGESTPDVLVSEFMKGEKELIEQILQTEINLFRSIRDGTALMQHMEDFYYISLLEHVRSNYKTVSVSIPNKEENRTARSMSLIGAAEAIVVVGVGSAVVDYLATVDSYPNPDDKIRSTGLKVQGGGNVGNALTCAARLGLKPRLISKVSDDALGRGVLKELEADGVDTSYLVVSKDGNSPFTYVIVDNETKTRTCIHTPGYPPMVPDDLSQSSLSSALDGARLAYFDVRLHETALVVAEEATRRKIPILVDAEKRRDGLDSLLNLASFVVCSAKFPQGTQTLGMHYARLRSSWEELSHYDSFIEWPASAPSENVPISPTAAEIYAKIVEKTRVFQFIAGLNLDFEYARVHLLDRTPFPTLEEAHAYCLSDESRRSPMPPISGIPSETSAMVVRYAYPAPPSVLSQTSLPSLSPLPAASSNSRPQRKKCDYCGK